MIPRAAFEEAMAELFEPIAAFLQDPEVSEVMVNGPDVVFTERKGRLRREKARFESEATLQAALRLLAQYAGRPLDDAHPILEGRLPDGSRVEAVLGVLAEGGSQVAIRKFHASALTLPKLVASGTLSAAMADYLQRAVSEKRNIVVSGGTGSGKTSLLKVLASCIAEDQRIVVLEDARELSLTHAHVVALEARPADERGRGAVTIRQLLRATLRLRPDRIVLGEIRDGAALDLLQAMTSGHGGCLSTLHASHPGDALTRLETMALFADTGLPLAALRQQIGSAVDVVVQVERLRSGARVVAGVAELRGSCPQRGFRWHVVHAHPEAHGWFARAAAQRSADADTHEQAAVAQ